MATYFHSASEIQADGLQTLYLMNPGSYVSYSDAPATTNMAFMNSGPADLIPPPMNLLSHTQSNHPQHFAGIPLHSMPDSSCPVAMQCSPDMPITMQGLTFSLNMSNSINQLALQGHQGLSLSLSQEQPPHARSYRPEPETRSPVPEELPISRISSCMMTLKNVLMGSKYLKSAQELLDEVANVGKGIHQSTKTKGISLKKDKDAEGIIHGGDESAKRGAELTTPEKQDLQMKKAKLVNMLHEVEQRYRQYHSQMQMVITGFEGMAGTGSARTYTALALQTISKQFRCLRDAISGQIQAMTRSLGEDDCLGGATKSSASRLRYIDHHLRQQRAFQQLGMMQHSAWRPQRGLPERAVSVLRAWLFEHFLHPYPKDSEKQMLAKQTELTRSQVSNWFINARVRLWKPMVEEMYLEELNEQEHKAVNEKPCRTDGFEDSLSNSSAHEVSCTSRNGQSDHLQTMQNNTNDSQTHPMVAPATTTLGNLYAIW